MSNITVDQVVEAYLKLKDEQAQIMSEAKQKADAIDTKLLKMEAWIKEQADAMGVTSFKTAHGTAFFSTVDFANVADWEAMKAFAVENNAFDLFEKRVSKTAVRGYIEERGTVPPGVNYGTRLDVKVRRASSKLED